MSRQTVTARTTPMVVALCLAICFTLTPRSLAAADPETSASPAVPASPLLQALAYAPRDAVSVTFTDWAGLKAQHGGTGVTSASPLADRQALLLEIGGSEAVLAPLGLDLLDAWPSAWGWDSTDLAWQLGPVTPTSTPVVLRFRDAWDPAPFMAQLDRHGFVREDGRGLFSYAPGPEAWYDPGEALGRAFGLESAGSVTQSSAGSSARSAVVPAVSVTFVGDGRTVIIDRDGTGRELARQALKRDPADTGASRFGRVAARLGEPLVAVIAAGEHGCSGTGQENARLLDDDARLARAVGELHPYEAFGAGYQRLAKDAPPTGRYVFDYARRHQATDDLAGRSTLAEQGLSADGRRPYPEAAFTLGRAEADGHDLVLDVDPVLDPPTVLFDELWGRPYGQSGVFAICGPPSTREPLVQRPTADVPLFVGPATVSLSGQSGRYAWDEVRFGADRVMVATTASAGQEPCATYLELDDRSDRGGVLSSGMLMAGAGEEANRKAAVEVDYATAGLRVGSTCSDWSLTLEPLEDPGLPYRVTERYYPVQGQTIEELASQADRAKDGWTAYAGWHTDWRFWWQEAAHSCDLTHGDVDLQARITYPRWRQPDDAAPATVTRWERFMRNLRTHEMGHITIALQGADAIDELLDGGLSGPDCEQLERLADRAAERLHDRYERLNDRYDEATDHGLAQGTGLP